ncbi:D-hexose-6-phosphate mutarotase [Actinobacillus equuli subsp. haemolyticus]|uniref:D-hexose-6-phosphate mutarotase n=1 Tax=Actinobacillus equuli TaxID=718 RepID=UPI00244673B0|nr:D-hexose-6-phosphate mutarotase [Actinobacillus equuli]WGE50159.1 D-hexose-6-phosphate mutarotase [Actinobacillus equuli subsp. haemolyticus]
MKTEFIRQISQGISLEKCNELYVIRVQHTLGSALVALQGAQLLSWQPAAAQQDVLWLSEIEPFQKGNAIRGGVPICYPWFGSAKSPSHGTARIREWSLSHYEMDADYAYLEFSLYDEQNIIEAKIEMAFNQECHLIFTHYAEQEAQAALHSYFNVADIQQTEVKGLPHECFDSLTKQFVQVPSPRKINENVDCIYSAEQSINCIEDAANQRTIQIEHIDASDIVLWNPWHKATSSMSKTGYQTMLCVETARINRKLQQGESFEVIFKLV